MYVAKAPDEGIVSNFAFYSYYSRFLYKLHVEYIDYNDIVMLILGTTTGNKVVRHNIPAASLKVPSKRPERCRPDAQ